MAHYIITGTSAGLGGRLAEVLLRRGHRVSGAARRAVDIRHPKYRHFQADLMDLAGLEPLVRSLLSEEDPESREPLCLINNAASPEPLAMTESETWPEVAGQIQLNLTVPLLLTGAFLRLTKPFSCRRQVVMVSSGLATLPLAGLGGYAASKAGLEHFVRCLRLECASMINPPDLAVVNPGMMDTVMQEKIRQTDPAGFPSAGLFSRARESGRIRPADTVAEFLADRLEQPKAWTDEPWVL